MDHLIYLDPRHGGEFQANSARHLLNSLNSLGFPKCLTFECFQSFQEVVRSCFGTFRNATFAEDVINFKRCWEKLNIPVTTKVHIVICHVVPFLEFMCRIVHT